MVLFNKLRENTVITTLFRNVVDNHSTDVDVNTLAMTSNQLVSFLIDHQGQIYLFLNI